MPVLRPLVPAALCALLAACSTRVPIRMSGPSTPRAEGVATTTLYTGTLQAGGCRGNFTGAIDAGPAPLFVSCDGGRQGRGVAVLQGGQFVSGQVTWADGGRASIIVAPPELPARPEPAGTAPPPPPPPPILVPAVPQPTLR